MVHKTTNILAESGLPLIYKSPPLAKPSTKNCEWPENIRTHVNSLTVFQKEAFTTSQRSSATWRLASDEGKYLLGHDEAPAPLAFFVVGMTASIMNEIRALAEERSIDIKGMKLNVDNFYSMSGSMRQGTMTAGAEQVVIEGQFKAGENKDALYALLADAVIASPIGGLMRQEKKSLFSLNHNGHDISLSPDISINSHPQFSENHTSELSPLSGDWHSILQKNGLTPTNEHSTDEFASSLSDQQNRLLHLRGIGSFRDDGVKEINQLLFNPHGTQYNFLSDESQLDGGKEEAPSAAAYLAAGIGFCFMTQFGRFAKMQDSKLKAYRIVQDAFQTLGGASANTGEPGDMAPLETHVYLESDEDDMFAKKILAISEQTCFLHAFTRTSIKPKICISRLA